MGKKGSLSWIPVSQPMPTCPFLTVGEALEPRGFCTFSRLCDFGVCYVGDCLKWGFLAQQLPGPARSTCL